MYVAIFQRNEYHDIILNSHNLLGVFKEKKDAVKAVVQKFEDTVFRDKNGKPTPFEFKQIAEINHKSNSPYDNTFDGFIVMCQEGQPIDTQLSLSSYSRKNQSDLFDWIIEKEDFFAPFKKTLTELHATMGYTMPEKEIRNLFDSMWNDPENGFDLEH